MDCDQVGSIGTLTFLVWYNADSIVNIMSMSEVAHNRPLAIDTSVENAIWMHQDDRQILKFVECAGGYHTHHKHPNCRVS